MHCSWTLLSAVAASIGSRCDNSRFHDCHIKLWQAILLVISRSERDRQATNLSVMDSEAMRDKFAIMAENGAIKCRLCDAGGGCVYSGARFGDATAASVAGAAH